MIDLRDIESGLLGVTTLPLIRPIVPSIIELHENHLHWTSTPRSQAVGYIDVHFYPGASEETRRAEAFDLPEPEPEVDTAGALDLFIKLSTGEDVERFARRHGVLEFCKHRLPASHNPRAMSMPLIGLFRSPSVWKPMEAGMERGEGFVIEERGERPWCEPTGIELIEDWLFWARMARSIVNIALALGHNRPSSAEDWNVILTQDDDAPRLVETLVSRQWVAQIYLAEAVNLWLRIADVRPTVSWQIGSDMPSLEFPTTEFGVLGVQLLTAITGGQRLTVCDGCGKPYMREGRRPQAGRANYCSVCRQNKVPERDRQRRRRDKLQRSQGDV
ncbi:MAG: hypothetical protein ACE5JL_17635 [Dehalococcoidia bacterium]